MGGWQKGAAACDVPENEYAISERHACQAMQITRSSYRYVGQQERVDAAYREVIRLSGGRYPYFGYRKIYELMRGSWSMSRARVLPICRREGLQMVKKRRKRKLMGTSTNWVHRAGFPEPRLELRFRLRPDRGWLATQMPDYRGRVCTAGPGNSTRS